MEWSSRTHARLVRPAAVCAAEFSGAVLVNRDVEPVISGTVTADAPPLLRVLLIGGTDEDYAGLAAYLGSANEGHCSLAWQPRHGLAVQAFSRAHFEIALIDMRIITDAQNDWLALLEPFAESSTDACARKTDSAGDYVAASVATQTDPSPPAQNDSCAPAQTEPNSPAQSTLAAWPRQVILFNVAEGQTLPVGLRSLATLPKMGQFCPVTLDRLLAEVIGSANCDTCMISRQGMAQLAYLYAHVPVPTCILNQHGQVLLWNRQAEALLGYARADILGESVAALETDETRDIPARVRAVPADGLSKPERWVLRHKNGKALLLRMSVSHLRLEHVDLYACHLDQEGLLGSATAEPPDLLEQVSRQMLAFVDTSMRCRAVNQSFAQAFGVQRTKMVGQALGRVLPQGLVAQVEIELERCFSSGQFRAEHVLEFPGRGRRNCAFMYVPSQNVSGRVTGAAITVREISDADAEERELALVRQVQAAVYSLQTGFISGAPRETLVDQTLTVLCAISHGRFGFIAERRNGVLMPSRARTENSSFNLEPSLPAGESEQDAYRILAAHVMGRIGPVSRATVKDFGLTETPEREPLPFGSVIVLPVYDQGALMAVIYVGLTERQGTASVLDDLLPLLTTFESVASGYDARVKLEDAETRYRLLYDENPALLIELSAHGGVDSVNKYGARLLGYSPEALADTNLLTLLDLQDVVFAGQIIDDLFHKGKETTVAELKFKHADGHSVWMRLAGRVIVEGPEPKALLACKDISENRKLSDEVAYHASHDALTGLINRREFERTLHLTLSELSKLDQQGALLLIDIDMFRLVNDAAGHKAGDALLQGVAARLKKTLRQRDVVARLGGDEFAVLLPDCQENQVLRAAEDLLAAITQASFVWQDREFMLQAHVGVVMLDGRVRDVGEVLSTAEASCVEAKAEPNGNIAFATGETSALKRRREAIRMLDEIRAAMAEDRLALFHQVIKPTTRSDSYQHCEILIRLMCHNGDLLPPGLFLPVAEQYRLMRELDQWVINAVFKWFAGRRDVLHQMSLCSINLSGQSVGDPNMQGFIRERVMIYRLPPGKFCFEVTETAVMEDIGRSINFIEALRRDGFKFAIDDFGSGLASFGYLKRLPVDFVKIDGMFVKDIEEDDTHEAIVASIDQISKVMGKETIAEFVENDRVARMLAGIGVDYLQGYGIGRPEPITRLAERLGKSVAPHLKLISDAG